MSKPILDACCGSRMFWFDKSNPDAVFIDKRSFDKQLIWSGKGEREGEQAFLEVKPDIVMDFRKMEFEDESFHLVVFDPPHLIEDPDASYAGYQKKKYGSLHPNTWKTDLQAGFTECFLDLLWRGERGLSLATRAGEWDGSWWFAVVRKDASTLNPEPLKTQVLNASLEEVIKMVKEAGYKVIKEF